MDIAEQNLLFSCLIFEKLTFYRGQTAQLSRWHGYEIAHDFPFLPNNWSSDTKPKLDYSVLSLPLSRPLLSPQFFDKNMLLEFNAPCSTFTLPSLSHSSFLHPCSHVLIVKCWHFRSMTCSLLLQLTLISVPYQPQAVHSPRYSNFEANVFTFVVDWKHLVMASKNGYERKDQHFRYWI